MIMYHCERAFVEDRFQTKVNIYTELGRIKYVGPFEPFAYEEKRHLGEVWPMQINAEISADYKTLGQHVSYGEGFFLDKDRSVKHRTVGLLGKIGGAMMAGSGMTLTEAKAVYPEMKLTPHQFVRATPLELARLSQLSVVPRHKLILSCTGKVPLSTWVLCSPSGPYMVFSEKLTLLEKYVRHRGFPCLLGSQGSVLDAAKKRFENLEQALYEVTTKPARMLNLFVGRLVCGSLAYVMEKDRNEFRLRLL